MENLELKSKEELIAEINRLNNLAITKSKKVSKLDLNEDKLNLIFDTIPYSINLVNEEGIILDCNKSLLKLHGYNNKEELIGQPYTILFPEYEIEQTKKDIKIIKSKGIVNGLLYSLRRKDGTTFPAEISSSVYIDNSNNEFILVSVANDISERIISEEEFQESKQTKISLQNERGYKKIILELIGIPVFLKDNDHRIIFANHAFFDLFGLDEKSVLGKTLAEQVPENERQHFLKIDRKVLDTGEEDIREEKLTVGGKTRVIITKKSRFIDESGTKFLVGSIKDITEINLVQKRFINTLENMTDGFVSLNMDWVYTYVNKTAAELFGRKPENLVGKHIWTEFPEGIDQPFYKNYYQAVETQTAINFEDYYQPWDKWFENRVIPSKNGISIFFHEITDRKKAELELKKYKEQLEELVKQRTKEIDEKNKKLEKLNTIFIGRELRMKELKKEITNLKKITNS